jgi:hypothetical protein
MPYPKPEPIPWTCATDIENMIVKHVKMLDEHYKMAISACIIDVKGTYIKGYGWVSNNTTKGVSDTHVTFKGYSFWVEVKYYNKKTGYQDTQKPHQKKFEERETKAGARYLIVKTFDDWVEILKEILSA